MRYGNLADKSGWFARRGLTVAARAAAFLLAVGVFAAPALEAQGTPAGTMIRSWAFVTYQNANAQQGVATSDTVSLLVGQVAGVDLEPPRVSAGLAGSAIVFAHSLANAGNGPDSFTVTAVSKHGWPLTLYRDRNGDGILDAGDSLLTGQVALGYAGIAHLLARVAIPGSGVLGASDTVTVTATSRFNAAAGDVVRDRVDIPTDPAVLSLTEQVDRTTAIAGDLLIYRVNYDVTGGGAAFGVSLSDTIPAGTTYVPGTLQWNGTALTDPANDDAGAIVPTGAGVVAVNLGTLTTGATGSVTFQVRVDSGPARSVDNRSHALFASAGTASDTAFSNAVRTSVLVPPLGLDYTANVLEVGLGEAIPYTLSVKNTGITPVSAIRIDTRLPKGARYAQGSAVGADSAVVTGDQLVLFTAAPLAPGATRAVR